MPRSRHTTDAPHGSLTVFEAGIVGAYACWMLGNADYSMAEAIAGGVVSLVAYIVLVQLCSGSFLILPIAILSIAIWGCLGWALGGMAFDAMHGAQMKAGFLTEPTVWRWAGAVSLVAVALTDKQRVFTPAMA